MRTVIPIIFLLILFAGNGQKVFNSLVEPLPEAEPWKRVYLIGDAGEDPENQSGLSIMAPMLEQDSLATVIFLGDNIYPKGLHGKKHSSREQDEHRLIGQMRPVKDHAGEVLFIPGNHDWQQGGRKGIKHIKRQQKFVERYFDEDDAFEPDKGCPGPEVMELGDLSIIIIDTQWWIHKHKKSIGEADGCDVVDQAQFLMEFNEALKKNRNKHVLVVGHHPLKSNGEHGGRFPLKDHIFPLSNLKKKLYIPLPVIGSIYPLYRKMLGDRQDIPHPVNNEMVTSLLNTINAYDHVVYSNGHEHNLQYFQVKANHLITSGSGSKVTHVGPSADLGFGAEKNGFARLSYYNDGSVWLQIFGVSEGGQAEELYSKQLYQKDVIDLPGAGDVAEVDYSDQTARVVGDSSYHVNGLQRFLMGSLNRELWLRPIEVPYLDLHQVKGGLEPLKMGGGMQSKSIRFQGGDGHQYVVRQIQKNTRFLVAKELRNTLAQDVVYDGIAGSHPYASIVIGALSDPVDVYHTNPKLVFLPKDSLLGDLMDEFGDSFCLFEERPDDDMSHAESMGRSEEVVSYGKMIEKVHEKKKHRVDEEWTLRSRLFDMLIGDWDRHDDQWRWATFKENGLTLYRPIPRDRDQAFFKFDGLLPSIANRKWAMRKFQKYGPDVRDIIGQNFNARFFDRSWLTQMDREDWQAQARYIQTNLTDEDIERAIALFPDTAIAYNGDFLRESLQARRENLTEIAERYYRILAERVSVVGKHDPDLFEVIRHSDGRVEVKVTPIDDGQVQEEYSFYHRIFHPGETKEIILYGLDGKDIYRLTGRSEKKSIRVRIVGGEEKDRVEDRSRAPGLRKMTVYYDDADADEVEHQGELKQVIRKEKNAIEYDRTDFQYDTYTPVPFVGANPDDGVYLGGGVSWNTFGFDKSPYRSKQTIRANYALKTGAYNLEYQGHFVDALGPFDIGADLQANRPFVFQYNGAGNETEEVPRDVSRTSLDRIHLAPWIGIGSTSGSSQVRLRVLADRWRLDEEDDELSIPITDDTFIGAGISYRYENVDNEVVPQRGIRFLASIDHRQGIEDPSSDSLLLSTTHPSFSASTDIQFTSLSSELSLYFPMRWMPVNTTLALRSGVKHNEGRFNFYQAAFIGGQEEFRGVRRNRYAGNTAFYNNAELRMDLRQFKNYTLPFRMGLLAHFDAGRVWLKGEDSDVWHHSYGGGVYFDILQFLTLNATYSISDRGEAFIVQGGFFF